MITIHNKEKNNETDNTNLTHYTDNLSKRERLRLHKGTQQMQKHLLRTGDKTRR